MFYVFMDYMYIISNNQDAIKVGISKQPEKRLKQLQTSNPNKLSLLFTEEFECSRNHLLKIEKLVHKELYNVSKQRVGEWFKVNTEDIERIKNIIIWNRIRYEQDDLYFKYGRF